MIHPEVKEKAFDLMITEALLPNQVVIPLQQHAGIICEPLVKVGDSVYQGQKIGESSSSCVHASVAGKVVRIEKGNIEIRTQNTEHRALNTGITDYIDIIKEAGIVGLGGAAFPTWIKLSPPAGKKIHTLLVNGCECEPYIHADHALMLEKPKEILTGAKLAAKAVGASRIIFGIEDNKKDAIKLLRTIVRSNPEQGINDGIEVIELKTAYPQGAEKTLIKSLLKKEVPSKGLPMDVGVVVLNVATVFAIFEAVTYNLPLIKRVVTVCGSAVKQPKNLNVRIGTSFKDVINQCGGLTSDPAKVIMGGPMMGIAVGSLDVPVIKATTCILAMDKNEAKTFEESSCIRCGRCIKTCPMGLLPNFMADSTKIRKWREAADLNVADCIECGCCSYVCPSRIPLVGYFKKAKQAIK